MCYSAGIYSMMYYIQPLIGIWAHWFSNGRPYYVADRHLNLILF